MSEQGVALDLLDHLANRASPFRLVEVLPAWRRVETDLVVRGELAWYDVFTTLPRIRVGRAIDPGAVDSVAIAELRGAVT